MADIHLDNQSKPTTPSSGTSIWFPDSTAKIPCYIDDAGRVWAQSHNAAVTAQGPGFSSDTYITNSDILVPSFGVQAMTIIRWKIWLDKTAAGTAVPVFTVRQGANRSTADTSIVTINGSANTAAADDGVFEVAVVVQSVSATGTISVSLALDHNLAATGLASNASASNSGVSAAFDNSNLGGRYIGLSLNAGASAEWTIRTVQVEARW